MTSWHPVEMAEWWLQQSSCSPRVCVFEAECFLQTGLWASESENKIDAGAVQWRGLDNMEPQPTKTGFQMMYEECM